jgi:hypothetical protein
VGKLPDALFERLDRWLEARRKATMTACAGC